MSQTVVPPCTRDYYDAYVDWKGFEPVAEHLNTMISGDPRTDWFGWLRSVFEPFDRVLSLNCGNGMVEQALFNWGAIKSVVGVDVSGVSLEAARQEAARLGLPAEYIAMDVNTDDLPEGPFDLVLNHAALHHVAFIDRVVRAARRVIADDGRLVHYDYTGPHRNQYDTDAWATTLELNASLPPAVRNDALCYPHLPTMLAGDPTEAVHSELILLTLDRYFDVDVMVPLGGAIAYQLLHQNATLYDRRTTPDGAAALRHIIEVDDTYTAGDPARSVFTFAVMTPRPGALDDEERLAAWSEEERSRERAAAENGSEYYPPTAFGMVYRALADEQTKYQRLVESEHLVARLTNRVREPRRLLAAVRRRSRRELGRLARSARRVVRTGSPG